MLFYVGRTLVGQWARFRGTPLVVAPSWGWVLASGAVVLASYAVLVQTWRAILGAWEARIPYWTAARIWAVSNLGRYVPGKVWQIGAMGVMAQQAGVSPIAAAGSAMLSTIVNIACGLAVAMVAGWAALDVLSQGHAAIGFVLVALVAVGLAVLPFVMPAILRFAERMLKRPLATATLPPRAVLYAIVGNVVAWLLYGVAFQWFVRGVVGSAPGSLADYVAVWAASYVIGYLFLFVPGGIGPRDASLAAAMPLMGLATPQQALLVTAASRLWLTVLEIVPGLVFLIARRGSRQGAAPGRAAGGDASL